MDLEKFEALFNLMKKAKFDDVTPNDAAQIIQCISWLHKTITEIKEPKPKVEEKVEVKKATIKKVR